MQGHKLNPDDEILLINSNNLIAKEDGIYIEVNSCNIIKHINIFDLSPRDIFLVLYKTKYNYFSRYFKPNQLIQNFDDLKSIMELKSVIENLTNADIARAMKYIDPNETFKTAYDVALYKSNVENNIISIDEVVENFTECKRKRDQENRAIYDPITEKRYEEENA